MRARIHGIVRVSLSTSIARRLLANAEIRVRPRGVKGERREERERERERENGDKVGEVIGRSTRISLDLGQNSSRSQSSSFNAIFNSASRISSIVNLVECPWTSGASSSEGPWRIFSIFSFFRFTFRHAANLHGTTEIDYAFAKEFTGYRHTRAARTSLPRAVQADIESSICISAASQCSRLTIVIPAAGLRSDAFAMHYTDAPSQRRKRRRIESDKRLRSLSFSLSVALSSFSSRGTPLVPRHHSASENRDDARARRRVAQ